VAENKAAPRTGTDTSHLAARLTAALHFSRHSERVCAQTLRERFGLAYASQSNVSRWASGRVTPKGPATTAIVAYIREYGPPDPEVENGGDAADPIVQLERQLTGEPSLGARQRSFVDALISRIGHATEPFTAEDLRVASWLSEVLGFPKPLR